MEELTEILKKSLNGKRNFTKIMFKALGAIYRGVEKGRFTLDEGLEALNKKVGAVNEK